MNKTIIASAIAATLLSTSAFAAEMAMPTVYGNIQLAWTHGDTDGDGGTSGLANNGSTIGFKHSAKVNDDLTAFAKIEYNVNNSDDSSNPGLTLDEAYVGVKGNFGKVWIGSDDSVYENYIDLGDGFEALGVTTGDNYSGFEGNQVQFVSSSMEGFQVFASVELDASSTSDTYAIDNDSDSATFGDVVLVPGATERNNAFQLGLAYSADNLTLAIGMDSNDSDGDDAKSTFGVSATYTMDNLKLVGAIQSRDEVSDIVTANAVYTAGANQYILSLSHTSEESDEDTTVVGLQALHNLSSNMYVYAETAFFNMEDAKTKDFAVGVTYLF